MTSEDRLTVTLRKLRRRALADAAVRWGLRGALGAALWATVVLVFAHLRGWGASPAAVGGGAAVAAAGAAVAWWLTRPSLALVARIADHRLGLCERLATALQVGPGGGDLARRLVADAASRAESVRPGDAYPLRRHRAWAIAVAAAAVTAVILAALPRDGSAALAAAPSAERAVVDQARSAVADQERRTADQLKRTPEEAARLGKLDQALRDALAELNRATNSRQALEKLSALSEQLALLSDPGAVARSQADAAAGDALSSAVATQQAGADLKAGKGAAAAADLGAVATALPSMTPEQQRQLAQALSQGATAAGADPALSSALSAAASALATGDTAGAQRQLGGAATAARDTESAASIEQRLQAARAAIENARERAAAQADAAGQGQGQGQEQGQGQGQGHGQGHGQGQVGTGTAAGTDQIYVAGQGGVGITDPGPLSPGAQIPLRSLADVLQQFQQTALDAVSRTVVNPDDRDLIRQYFSSLGAP